MRAWLFTIICVSAGCASSPGTGTSGDGSKPYDLAIINGRVMDPESGLDAIRHLGVTGGRIETVTSAAITGRTVVDAQGLVVAPGFIDLHQHTHSREALRLKVLDGVTTACEMETGVRDIDEWYAKIEGTSPIHFGAAIGHPTVRMAVLTGAISLDDLPSGEGATRAATAAEIGRIRDTLRNGLKRGALGVGLAPAYTPGATPWEVLEVFRTAAEFPGAPVHVHVRETEPPQHWMEVAEVMLAAVVTGAPLQIVHANSSYGGDAPRLFEMIVSARARGIDVTTEAYPYTAGMTDIQSAPFDGWPTWSEDRFSRFIWPPTGERLTRGTFGKYRAQGGLVVIETNTEEKLRPALASPLTMIVSDGGMMDGVAHPRLAGTYARMLGKYVREENLLPLMEALRKMTLMPAQRLEARAPAMKNKGRIRAGADADIAIFDPATILDRSTYAQPLLPSAGMRYVIVNGVVVVTDGSVDESVTPGKAIRGR